VKLTGIASGLAVDPSSCTGRERLPDELSPFTGAAGATQIQEASG
jgi:hypothetical protein